MVKETGRYCKQIAKGGPILGGKVSPDDMEKKMKELDMYDAEQAKKAATGSKKVRVGKHMRTLVAEHIIKLNHCSNSTLYTRTGPGEASV